MKNIVAIIAGEPNSINSEIISKVWLRKKFFKNLNIIVIGNYKLIKKQLKKISLKTNILKIDSIDKPNLKKKLHILNVPLKFKDEFKVPLKNKIKYIYKCFNIGIKLAKEKKIIGLINCPVNKKDLFGNNFNGVTEFLAKKEGVLGKEAMLIYNRKLSVSPITTHIELKKISKKLSTNKIFNKIMVINKFYLKKFKIKPNIAILGLNPHNDEFRKNSEEKRIIIPAIKRLKNKKIKILGPLSADTAFIDYKKKNIDVIVGMYHDQVLSPFKTIFKFDAINITLGLPYIRISPDHGTGVNIIKKKVANYNSLLKSIIFFKD